MARREWYALVHTPQAASRSVDAARVSAAKSQVCSAIEHVFARQKGPMGLFLRTIWIARAKAKIGLANLAYNMQRLVWLRGRDALG